MIHQLFFGSKSAAGQITFTTPDNSTSSSVFSWVVPSNVTTISAVVVGGGGCGALLNTSTYPNKAAPGGAGGGLSYRNNIPVTPGETLTISPGIGGYHNVLTRDGAPSYIMRGGTILVRAEGGDSAISSSPNAILNGGLGGAAPADGGGSGGDWSTIPGQNTRAYGGGGGAGGYSGNGGDGGVDATFAGAPSPAFSNSGAGGGGYASLSLGAGGGGVGLQGKGSDGVAGSSSSPGGGGGSGGGDGKDSQLSNTIYEPTGGLYGGGGFGRLKGTGNHGAGGKGAVRIIWGPNRAFPSTNTADV